MLIKKYINFVKAHPKLTATVLFNIFKRTGLTYNYWYDIAIDNPEYCAGSLLTSILNKKEINNA